MIERILGDNMKKVANTIKIKKWRNGNGILLPKAILNMFSLKENDKIILTPIKKGYISLSERFKDYKGNTHQNEYWEDDTIGKEII